MNYPIKYRNVNEAILANPDVEVLFMVHEDMSGSEYAYTSCEDVKVTLDLVYDDFDGRLWFTSDTDELLEDIQDDIEQNHICSSEELEEISKQIFNDLKFEEKIVVCLG